MLTHLTPNTIRAPFAQYSHGVVIPQGHRLLVCSGQLGISPDDRIPDTVEEQTALCFAAVGELLGAADMDFSNIVRINAYVTAREHLKGYMAARDRFIASPPPASTLMIVSGFAREEFMVEIEVMAAKAG